VKLLALRMFAPYDGGQPRSFESLPPVTDSVFLPGFTWTSQF